MAVELVIQGVTYPYPTQDGISWGLQATNAMIAVVDALAIAVQAGDIGSSTDVTILETASNQAVTNLVFDSGITQGATIDYYVYRTKGINSTAEYGTFRVMYNGQTGTWSMEQQKMLDDSNISFDINASGQILYTTTPISGSGAYSGNMRYRARSIVSV